MKTIKENKQKNINSGITLIALVVTIILLLILAGVSISTLTINDGILDKARKAREETEISDEKQIIELSVAEAKINDVNNDVTDKIIMDPILDRNIGIDMYNSEKTVKGLIVTYVNTQRSYLINNEGNVILAYETKQPVEIPENNGQTFSRENGIIDIQFLTGTSYNIGKANPPKIDKENMIPVNWNGENWIVTNEENWDYNYGDTDTTRKWANVMLRDTLELEDVDNITLQNMTINELKGKVVKKEGSMFVWIPRYAYKITYYLDSKKEQGTEVGYSDARGLVDKEGKTPTGMNTPITSVAVGDNYYRPHPAFEDNSSTNSTEVYSQGEWSTKLEGFWMGKFETTIKKNDKITVLPDTNSYTNKHIGTFYTEAQKLEIANSHMTKNSEWGAMSYLTESIYGRNGEIITKNSDSSYISGAGNYKNNLNQSTTNNIYGIYDTVGGAWEYIAGYIADCSQSYGNSFASTDQTTNNKTESTQYATVYKKSEANSSVDNYKANINRKFGDGTIETSMAGEGITSWHSATSMFIGGVSAFFKRGGGAGIFGKAGIFYFDGDGNGSGNNSRGFRICLVVE